MLYIISTPIGNMMDISYRAIKTLESVSYMVVEDTRVTQKILSHHNISTKSKFIVYNDYSKQNIRDKIINILLDGNDIALLSDAGTPLISDPGYKLVQDVIANNIQLTHVPGSCSIINALVLSGLATDEFRFMGFLPNNKNKRIEIFDSIFDYDGITIFFDTAIRICDTLVDAIGVLGESRRCCVSRELTKLYEENKRGTLNEVLNFYLENKPLGEIILIIDSCKHDESYHELMVLKHKKEVVYFLEKLLSLNNTIKDSVDIVVNYCNKLYKDKNSIKYKDIGKKEIYDMALEIKKRNEFGEKINI